MARYKTVANVRISYLCSGGETDESISQEIEKLTNGLARWGQITNSTRTEFTLVSEFGSLGFDVISNVEYPKGHIQVFRSVFMCDEKTISDDIQELQAALSVAGHISISVEDKVLDY